ncbi:MAG: MotA/TolQ/ExbB proton channel family protein [Proteobacteria bacterium]|nr:MotA/TolQ/ExbB proton channel family protein [Pseudomonadota bacterium]MBU2226928.1 MotA/TolQ/ExbB proton channel family protein [Pseudomonadota bacterium]MBU2262420.1 MotA/TolQ/ExbB proton channel family protein [Pseudomonadota bacterium]
MSILAGFETYLYVVSSVMLFPVVTGLALLTFWVVICFGGFLREYIERRRGDSAPLQRYEDAVGRELLSIQDRQTLDIAAERLLQKAELELIKSLDRVRFVIRVGPALGLMGTLIPMGISLSSLAQGDMLKMAGSMVTAFTTVVVGLGCSVVAYVMSLVKEKWVRADMREMEYLTELMLRKANGRSLPERGEAEEDAVS